MTDLCFCSQHDLSGLPGGILREPYIHRRDVCGDPKVILHVRENDARMLGLLVVPDEYLPIVRESFRGKENVPQLISRSIYEESMRMQTEREMT